MRKFSWTNPAAVLAAFIVRSFRGVESAPFPISESSNKTDPKDAFDVAQWSALAGELAKLEGKQLKEAADEFSKEFFGGNASGASQQFAKQAFGHGYQRGNQVNQADQANRKQFLAHTLRLNRDPLRRAISGLTAHGADSTHFQPALEQLRSLSPRRSTQQSVVRAATTQTQRLYVPRSSTGRDGSVEL